MTEQRKAPPPVKFPTFGFKTSKIARPHNWLIHHYFWRIIDRKSRYLSGRLLDIGCGVKPYRTLLDRYCSSYVGLEHPSNRKGWSTVEVMGDALELPFGAGTFGSVVSFQVMEHLPEPSHFLQEVFRVLKPGGMILIMTPFMWGEHEQPYDFYRYTRFGLHYLLEKSGFEIVSIEPYAPYWPVAIVRFNYWLLPFARGIFKLPVTAWMWANQFMAVGLNKLDMRLRKGERPFYAHDYAGFTSIARKPVDTSTPT